MQPNAELTAADLVESAPNPGSQPNPPPAEVLPISSMTRPPEEPAENPFANERDSLGRPFVPGKFRLKDGRPQRDTLGRFVPANLGPKTRSQTPPADPQPEPSRPDQPAPGPEPAPSFSAIPTGIERENMNQISADVSADAAVGMIQTVLISIGEEEGVLSEAEEKMLKAPLESILQKYHLADKMTPELHLGCVLCVLIQRRLKKPKTQNWFQRRLLAFRSWWTAKKAARRVPDPMPEQ